MCVKVLFFLSHIDEEAFFEWVNRISFIEAVKECNDLLHISLIENNIPKDDLRELIALFYRYKIEMKQLQIFLNENNKEWFFDNKKAYWYRKIWNSPK